MKFLIIIDMQKDFIDGSLANEDAQNIVPGICNLISSFDGEIICTQDTHSGGYLTTNEGKHLPVPHCVKDTKGWEIDARILDELLRRGSPFTRLEKGSFGSLEWGKVLAGKSVDSITLVGTCTDICVISNALILKASFPETEIRVIEALCAGVTREKHNAAIEVMRSCQIEII